MSIEKFLIFVVVKFLVYFRASYSYCWLAGSSRLAVQTLVLGPRLEWFQVRKTVVVMMMITQTPFPQVQSCREP
jgi:hypothetical protein